MSLELRRVTKRVGAETHIHETTLALAPEGFNVLLGATNAGKSTLIKLMAGLEQPTTGEVWFRGKNVTGVTPRLRNVSLVHQFFINYPNMSVFENIASPLRVAGLSKAEIERRVGEAADDPAPDADARAQARRTVAAASSSAPRSPAPSSRTATSCCSTSRWRTSTTSCARNCATSCPRCSPGAARWWSTPPPSRPRR